MGKKKEWKQPELIILTRGKPDEFVLTNDCKTEKSGTYDGILAQHCGYTTDNKCAACQGRGGGGS